MIKPNKFKAIRCLNVTLYAVLFGNLLRVIYLVAIYLSIKDLETSVGVASVLLTSARDTCDN